MKKIQDFLNYRSERYKDIQLFRENKTAEDRSIEQFGASIALDTLTNMAKSSNSLLDFHMLETENQVNKTILKYELTIYEENRRNGQSYALTFFVNNDSKENNTKIEISKAGDLYNEQEKFNRKNLDYNLLRFDEVESIVTELLIDIRENDLQNENPGLTKL